MDLKQYRQRDLEKERTADLVRLINGSPKNGTTALDIGARDGHFSVLLTEFYDDVTALDLEKPTIAHENIKCVQGNITDLQHSDCAFDLVFCAEVLEHIPTNLLQKACTELSRVSRNYLIIGVPYNQDIRVGRTTCYTCGGKNPPWGHVNSFTRKRLETLFASYDVEQVSFVAQNCERTNVISTFLMDFAGNPFGTYEQEEQCIHCDQLLIDPPARTIIKKVLTRASVLLQRLHNVFYKPQPNWIHIVFKKQ